MTDSIRGFRPSDVEARGIDVAKFKTRSSNGCWPKPPPAPNRPPPPAECARVRCRAPAVEGEHCAEHDREEREWRALDVAALRHATRGHPEGSPTPRHPEGSN